MEHTRGIDLLAAATSGVRGLPTLQYVNDPGVIDLTWGHPDPTLLPVEEVAAAAEEALHDHGWKALTYGYAGGPAMLTEALIGHLPTIGERRPEPGELTVTGGNSAGLSLVLALFAEPGDVVIVESPTYFLALRIIVDHPVTVVGVPTDHDGIVPEELERAASATASNRGRRLVYTVPTHNNPTGVTTSERRRHDLLDVAARHRLTFIEDDVYREVSFGPRPGDGLPASMWTMAPDRVIRLGSFSKTLAPGLRVGYLTAAADIVERVRDCGVLDSGGGVNHFTACIVGTMIASGSYVTARDRVVASYDLRCAALIRGLSHVPSQLRFTPCAGGYFLWVRVPDSTSSKPFIAAARAAGVACSNGSAFFTNEPPDRAQMGTRGQTKVERAVDRCVRLSFSLYEPDELEAAGRLLATMPISD